MMANEKSESCRDNFGKFIYQLQPKTKYICQETLKDPNKTISTKCVHKSLRVVSAKVLDCSFKVSELKIVTILRSFSD